MIAVTYFAALLAALACMVLVDRRLRLVLWADARRGAVVVATGVAFFLLWDVVAIQAGFYARGDSPAMTGIMLAPELPLEELVFVLFLSYLTLVVHRLVLRATAARQASDGTSDAP